MSSSSASTLRRAAEPSALELERLSLNIALMALYPFARLRARRMPRVATIDDPGDEDAELEQEVEGDGLEQQRDGVAGQEGGDGAAREDGVAAVVAQLLGGDDARARGGEHADGHLEDEAHGEQDDGGEVVVLAGLHEHVELAAVEVLEEAHGGGQHDEVAEEHADDEEEGDGEHERRGDALLRGAERGQQERGELEEQHGQREDEREHERDGERGGERLADAERDGLVALRGGGEPRDRAA